MPLTCVANPDTMKHYRLFIANEFIDARSKATIESVNPATEEPIGAFPRCGGDDVDRAVEAAREAFANTGWPRMKAMERGRYLRRVASLIRDEADDLARLETQDSGKPIYDTQTGDLPEAATCFEIAADLATHLHGRTLEVPSGQYLDYTVREPVGVIASVAPWNYPLVNAAWKIAPAIAAGNCIVYKPAEQASLSTLRLAEIFRRAELPPGVVNVITGTGEGTGAALVGHVGVDKVSFTGSTATGRRVLRAAADGITDASLELGGKSANIVFDDCELDHAVAGALFAGFVNAGQVCTAGSRLLLQDAIYDTFMERFEARTRAIRIGDPLDPGTRMGPLIDEVHWGRVMDFIDRALKQGAQLRTGGRRPDGLDRGYYIEPTILENVAFDQAIDREEVFGPVVVVHRFRDDDEAARIADSTCYGLAAGVWTSNNSRAHRMAARLDAGTVWINTYNIASPAIPFAGFKQSGLGVELGLEGLLSYTRLKNVCIDVSDERIDYFD